MRVQFLKAWRDRFGYAEGQVVVVDGYNPDAIPAELADQLEADGIVTVVPEPEASADVA